MFSNAFHVFKNSVYIINCKSINGNQFRLDFGTGFFVKNDKFISVAHVCYPNSDFTQNIHQHFELFILQSNGTILKKQLNLINHDTNLDISLFETVDSYPFVNKTNMSISPGRSTCSYGFHYLGFDVSRNQYTNAFAKMKSGVISSDIDNNYYFIDTVMYKGSSGCPVFDINGDVIGMQQKNLTDQATGNFIDFSVALRHTKISDFLALNGINW